MPTVVRASAYRRLSSQSGDDRGDDRGDNRRHDIATNNACEVGSSRCGQRRCLTCPALKTGSRFTSTITGRSYKVLGNQALSCSTTSVVYLITCRRCGIQYVGETGQQLRKRMNNHRASIRNLQPQPIYKHFNSDGHSLEDLTMQPIERVELSDDDDEVSLHSKRLHREDFWMRELKTIQPYGLNDNVRSVGNISKLPVEPVVWRYFNQHKRGRKYKPRRRHSHRPDVKYENPKQWLISQIGNYKSKWFLKGFITHLFSCKFVFLRQIKMYVNELLPLREFPGHLLLICLDIIKFRLGDYNLESIPKASEQRDFLRVFFHSKGMEMVNLGSIMHSKQARSAIPHFFNNKDPPIISYKYTKPIGPTIFNFREVAREHDINDPLIGKCACKQSSFQYKPLGHVITGDLRIIKNSKLRSLVAKGPNYREQNNIDWDLCHKLCMDGINRYRKQWAKKEKVALSTLNEWTCHVKEAVAIRIKKLRMRPQKARKRQILRDRKCKQALAILHEDYVLVPADKAGNNVVVICKQYYKEVLTRELKNSDGASTYVGKDECVDKLIDKHLSFMLNHGVAVPTDNEKLPSFYWLPKLHKVPYGHRFIAASSACTTKPLSKLLTQCLKLVLKHYSEYCAGIEKKTGINCFWVVKNSTEVLNTLPKVRRASHLDSFDFSTLYTKIPHSLLKERMAKLITDAFSCRNASHIKINEKVTQARWSNKTQNDNAGEFHVDVHHLMEMFNFLVDNIFIEVGSKIFQQVIGIPMGTDCAPLVADLFLFSFEFDFMRALIRNNMPLARKFNRTFRYIDDLLTLNNPDFCAFIDQIYPEELTLKRTTEGTDYCSYLDIKISIVAGRYTTDLYDKRETFKFKIVNFPHMDSNIPSKPAYGVFVSQLIRYMRVCGNYQQFVYRSTLITTKLQRQGFDYSMLCRTFKKFLSRNPMVLRKYQRSHKQMLVECVSLPLCIFKTKSIYVSKRVR